MTINGDKGGNNGQIFIWDLEKKVLKTIVNNAHTNNVTHLQFLPSEPVLVSSSDDNSLKMWIFDLPDGSGRFLFLNLFLLIENWILNREKKGC